MDLKLYCTYHDRRAETQMINKKPWITDYYRPLVKSDWFIPYYTKEGHENSLDDLQEYFCEFTCLYYIYKNNIKSDYVGLCHYGRQKLRKCVFEHYDKMPDYISKKIVLADCCKNAPYTVFTVNFNNFLYD